MSLLPSTPDIAREGEPRVIGLDSEEADKLMAALSSETARRVLSELHEEPAPPGELADRVDTSLQNAQYHLDKLEAAGAVEVVGTAYSEKGREMSVYGPADSPLVIFAGDKEREPGLKSAIARLFGGFLALAVGAIAVQAFFGDRFDGAVNGQGGDAGTFSTSQDASRSPTTEAEDAAPGAVEWFEAVIDSLFAGGLSPGLAFFLGGMIVLTITIVIPYLQTRIRSGR